MKTSFLYFSLLLYFFCTNQLLAQIPSCTSSDCNTIEANWELVSDSLFVCEGETFQVSGAASSPLDNIETFHWYFIDNATLEILFDTILFDTSYVSYTYNHSPTFPCANQANTIDLLVDLIVTSPDCGNGATSCNWKLSSVVIELKPISIFNLESEECLPNLITFENSSCYAETYLWDFGDGTTSSLPTAQHMYSAPGDYEVTLTVSNSCGTDVSSETITIIEPAISNPIPEPGYVDTSNDTIFICLDSLFTPVTIPLNGDSLSLHETSYAWNNLNFYAGASWLTDPPSNDPTPNIPDPAVVFSDTGLYLIILTVDNACLIPNSDTIFFKILSGTTLADLNQDDVCLNLSYVPQNFNPNATYTVNGDTITTFPTPLELGVGTYSVVCYLENLCGDQIVSDEFEITNVADVFVIPPDEDTLCIGSDLILLDYGPPGGTWSGSNNLIFSPTSDSVWYNPSQIESVSISYSDGVLLCNDMDGFDISVIGVNVTTQDYQKCEWSTPFPLSANPPGGTWSSIDCPSCIVNDSFVVSTMVNMGLTIVNLNYTVTSSAACEGMGTSVVEIVYPIADFTMADTFCTNQSVTVNNSMSVGTQYEWRLDGVASTAPPYTSLSAGNYNLELVSIIGECRDSVNFDFTIIAPPPAITFTATPLQGCADLDVLLAIDSNQLSGLTYTWSLDGTPFSFDFDPGLITLPQGLSDTTYTISVSTGNGCGGEIASQDILVFPKPTANFGTNQNEYCSGDTVYFANVSFGTPTAVFWDFGNGLTSTELNPPPMIYFTGDTPSIYTVSLIATNNCGTDTLYRDIVVNPTDVNAFFNVDPVSACVGEAFCFESFSTIGAALEFDFGDGNTTSNPSPCHVYTTPGTYEVSLKVFGCGFDSIVATITVLPLPEVDIILNPSYCPNELIPFSALVTNVVDYVWDFGDGDSDSISTPQHAYATPGTYLVHLTGISIDNCVQNDSVLVTIMEPPNAVFTLDSDSICTGTAINFINLSSPDVVTCFWDFGDGNFSTDCSPSYTYTINTPPTATLIVSNANDCEDTTSQVINLFPDPEPAFSFINNQQCSPVEVTFTNLSQNGESYFWDFGNGQTSTETNPTIVYGEGGIYTIELTVTNGLCARSVSLVDTIYQTPEFEVPLGDISACFPDNVIFEVPVPNPDHNYLWDFGDGNFSFENFVDYSYAAPGDYPVKLLVTANDFPFCKDSISEIVNIYEQVLANETVTDVLCFGESTGQIDITTTSGTAPFQYDWSNGSNLPNIENIPAGNYGLTITDSNNCMWDEEITVAQSPQIISFAVDSSIVTCFGGDDGAVCIDVEGGNPDYTINWENGTTTDCLENVAAGNYTVSITDANNCLTETSFNVFENPVIAVSDSVVNVSCFGFGDGFILLDNITGGVSDIYNTTLTGPVDYEGGYLFQNLLPGNYSLTVQDLEGCMVELDYSIGEPDSMWMNIVEDSLYLNMGDSIRIEVDHNANQALFDWSPFNTLNCIDCEDPWAQPLKTTSYSLSLTDVNGCSAKDDVLILVDPNRKFYIPNTFTPNNDGRNDLFRIRSRISSIRKVNTFQVYDRWGELLFERNNFRPQEENERDAWNGTYRGKELSSETFTYYVEIEYLDGVLESAEGTITLIR